MRRPWEVSRGIHDVVASWRAEPAVRACLCADRVLPATGGAEQPFPPDLAPALVAALRHSGIEQLYCHQHEAIAHAVSGRHVVTATPTASGKSLCFHLPVLDALARDPSATAFYLYPTKALARDQEHGIRALARAAGLDVAAIAYDGDTPGDARRVARERAQIIMTNPDMLHAGILPQHASWARALSRLRYVIVDELHSYRGVFGSHVAHVFSRLMRVAAFHGSRPAFLCASATVGNPADHACRLLGVEPSELAVVERSTAPRAERIVMLYNPPVVNAELGIRRSYLKSAVALSADLLRAGVRTLIFGQSRNAVEIMLKYLRDGLRHEEPSLCEAIMAYRGGYLPGQRRHIEQSLRKGELLGVVATSALELGIDIGALDAVVCAGYPGTLAETWQRFGRAGRRPRDGRQTPSLALLVTSSAPLDQYLASHPEHLLDGSIEHARCDPDNAEIAIQHLKCAAFELPFARREPYSRLEAETAPALDFLAEHGVVRPARERYHWSAEAFPAHHVSLRQVGWDNFVIVDQESDSALAELDWHSAPGMLHEQAIYQHDGLQYQVERLDYDNHKAFVRRVEPDYFTTALRDVKVRVLEVERALLMGPPSSLRAPPTSLGAWIGWGDVCVTEKIVGYKKVKFHTHENAGYGDVRLPDIDLHTTSFWITLPDGLAAELERPAAIEGLRGLLHALAIVSTLALMCDSRDIGRAIEDCVTEEGHTEEGSGSHDRTSVGLPVTAFAASAYLYDSVPGGVGLAERIFERAAELGARAAELILGCRCSVGCPSCVGAVAPGVGAGSAFDRRAASVALMRGLGLATWAEASRQSAAK
jgi:DEAD/DEAH box helicase domain-containing protein